MKTRPRLKALDIQRQDVLTKKVAPTESAEPYAKWFGKQINILTGQCPLSQVNCSLQSNSPNQIAEMENMLITLPQYKEY